MTLKKSLKEIADAAKISESYLSRIETDYKISKISEHFRACRVRD